MFCVLRGSLGGNTLGSEGAAPIAEMLKVNTTLTSLRCALRSRDVLAFLPKALVATDTLRGVCSLELSGLLAEGVQHIAAALKENKTLTYLKCAEISRLEMLGDLRWCLLFRQRVSSH